MMKDRTSIHANVLCTGGEKDVEVIHSSKDIWADQPPTAAEGRGCSADLRECQGLSLGAGRGSKQKKSSWSLNWLQGCREYG